MQRRDFLKKTSLLATSTYLTHLPEWSDFERLKKGEKVLILGAGLAGLSAAYVLSKNNVPVKLLEARTRIGGRIFTYFFPRNEQLHTELGAEWVGDSHNTIKQICQELNLPLVKHQFQIDWFLENKMYKAETMPFSKEWSLKLQKIFADFRKMSEKEQKKLDQISWWRFLVNNGIPEQELTCRELNDSTDFGESIHFTSAFAALSEYADSSQYNEMDYKIQGGNSSIIKALAQKVGENNTFLGKKVKVIRQQSKKVEVICEDASTYEADKVICTLPVYALAQINFEPTLPESKKLALQQLQYARIIKMAVLFRERFWQREDFALCTDLEGHFVFHTTQNQANSKGILHFYAIGDKAYILARKNKEARKKVVIDTLQPIFGNIEALIEDITGYYWGSDAYTQGAYALYQLGQWFNIRQTLAQPFKNVFFAGEHLAEWQGFMEGAAQTGKEIAEKLIGK
ncbi:flavin monoamine oxidase family protein [Raineya orbicola]|uniref:Monoamine oxidase n=1 Tax=Raineya orbicola TaxID=2016530 RepID=A0A2N3IB06_9BACT|nr:NAD(P)/FAD-dependent oxidoreductase [Raineya orbicola]PKQ67465.1 Monoamine oxidase [Raineya orbicola]